MAEILLKHVYKKYEDGVVAVKDFNLEIKEKEFVIFVGPSGCGKSTTLRMIAGLEEISDGELYVDGKYMNQIPSCDRNMAMVFQNYALYPHMTVYDNIAYSMKLKKVSEKEIKEKVQGVAKMLGLTEVLGRRPGELSGGQKQRVAMGRAIVRKPKIFLMDEPLSNLDAKLRNQMRSEISKLYQESDSTFIYVTHDQVEAMTLGTKIVVLKDGEIQQVASPMELYERPSNRFVAGFIGTPPMNFFDSKCVPTDGRLYIQVAGAYLQLPEEFAICLREKSYINQSIIVGIRAEDIQLDPCGEIKGVVEVYEMLGDFAYLYLDCEGYKITARVPAETKVLRGDSVRLTFDIQKIHLFDPFRENRIC